MIEDISTDEKNKIDAMILHDICKTQALLFQTMASRMVNMHDFIKNYMTSGFCNRQMDSLCDHYQIASPDEIIPELKNDFKIIPDPLAEPIDKDDAYEIGYIYRYISRKYNISSKELVSSLPYSFIIDLIREYPDASTRDYIKWSYDKIRNK